METLGRINTQVLVPQIVLGTVAYLMPSVPEQLALTFALTVAGLVAVVFIGVAVRHKDALVMTSALSSVSAALTLLCLTAPTPGVESTAVFGFFTLITATVAAMIARERDRKSDSPITPYLHDALPVVGACRYLLRRIAAQEARR